jgi:alanyl-tRNA synthetase
MVLGDHVAQKGSLVSPERLRFDIAHPKPITRTELEKVEDIANRVVLENAEVTTRLMGLDDARALGARALFGEKYGDEVRVLEIGSSRELCGGTHVARTGDIGLFKIVAEGGVAAGVRRVEAVTGDNALAYLQALESTLGRIAGELRSSADEVPARVGQVLEHVRALEKELAALKGRLASSQGDDLAQRAVDVKGLKVLAARLDGADAKTLRETLDKLKDKLKTAVIVLAAVDGAKVQIAAGVTADSTGRVKAGEVANFVAAQIGGKGGGKADMAMAGGSDPSRLPEALASVRRWVEERV